MDYKKALKKIKDHGIDPTLLNVSFQLNSNVAGWSGEMDPLELINVYSADIELFLDDGYENKVIIGEVVCYYLDGFSAIDEAYLDMRYVADSMTQDFYDSVIAVTDHEGQLLDDYYDSGVLYIHRYYLKPEYRGKGIGEVVLRMIINIMGRGAGVITVIPSAVEEDGKERIESDDPRYSEVYKKHTTFYKRLGFKQLNDEVWAKNTGLKD